VELRQRELANVQSPTRPAFEFKEEEFPELEPAGGRRPAMPD